MNGASVDTADSPQRARGRVIDFDEHRGLGTVETASGDRIMFHCVELSDGTRRIELGADVDFVIRTKFSRPEAFSVRRIESTSN